MPATRLSDTMITALLDALLHRTSDGRYRVFANARTMTALETRGKVEREESPHGDADQVPYFVLTADAVTYLRNALEYTLGERGEDRDPVWQTWFTTDRRHEWALIDFLGLTADTYEITTTTPQERRPHRETLGRADAWERIGNTLRNGQRITLDDGTMTAHTKLGARWTFKPLGFAVEVEHTSYERYTGAHGRGWARRLGIDNPASVRSVIDSANRRGDKVTTEDGGVIRVDNAGHVDPGFEGAGQPCPVWFVPVRRDAEEGSEEAAEAAHRMARAESLLSQFGDAQRFEHTVKASAPAEVATFDRGVTAEIIAAELGKGARVAWVLVNGPRVLVLRRDGFATDIRAVEETEERGMPKGPHRIVNTGDDIEHTAGDGGKYGIRAFECTRCHKRAILADFEYGRVECTEEAEAEHARECAEALLNDVTFKDATAYEVEVPTDDNGGRVTYTHERDTTVRFVAALLGLGATHGWFRDGLRLTRDGIVHKVRPVVAAVTDAGHRALMEAGHAQLGALAERHAASCDAEEARLRAQGERDRAASLGARFLPQDPADEDTRPCVELPTGEQVYVYRKGGSLVVSVDVDTATVVRDDGTVPMVITVAGNTVFEG